MKKILIVEDNELNMKLFFDILEYQKYTPIKAINGLEAYKVIKEEERKRRKRAQNRTYARRKYEREKAEREAKESALSEAVSQTVLEMHL